MKSERVIRCGSRFRVRRGAQPRFCQHRASESRRWQKFGPQNGGSGEARAPRPPLDPHLVMKDYTRDLSGTTRSKISLREDLSSESFICGVRDITHSCVARRLSFWLGKSVSNNTQNSSHCSVDQNWCHLPMDSKPVYFEVEPCLYQTV